MAKMIGLSAVSIKKLVLAVVFTLEASYLLQFTSMFAQLPHHTSIKALQQCPVPYLSQLQVQQRVCHVHGAYEQVQPSQPTRPLEQAGTASMLQKHESMGDQLELTRERERAAQPSGADVNTDMPQAQAQTSTAAMQLMQEVHDSGTLVAEARDNQSGIAQAPEAATEVIVIGAQEAQPPQPSTQADLGLGSPGTQTTEPVDSSLESPQSPVAADVTTDTLQDQDQPTAPSTQSGQGNLESETQITESRDSQPETVQVPAGFPADVDTNTQPTADLQEPAGPTADIITDTQQVAAGETYAAEHAQPIEPVLLADTDVNISATQAIQPRVSQNGPISEQLATYQTPVGDAAHDGTLDNDLQQSAVVDREVAEQPQETSPATTQAVQDSDSCDAQLTGPANDQAVSVSEQAEAVQSPADSEVLTELVSSQEQSIFSTDPSLNIINDLGVDAAPATPEVMHMMDVKVAPDTATTEMSRGLNNLMQQQVSNKSKAPLIIAVTIICLCVLAIVITLQQKAAARQQRRTQRLAALYEKERDYDQQYQVDNDELADQQQPPRSPIMDAVADVAAVVASPLVAQGLRILHLASPPPPPPTRITRSTTANTTTTAGSRRMTRSQAAEAAASDPRWDGLDAVPAPASSRASRGKSKAK